MPVFLREGNRLDAAGRAPGEPEFDATSLLVPPEWLAGVSGYLQQYFAFKAAEFDKVVLIARGRFFDSLFSDALLVHETLDYAFQARKLKVGIPDHTIERDVLRLVARNLTVAIATQQESESEYRQRTDALRLTRGRLDSLEKCVRRQVSIVHTKGTLPLSLGQSRSRLVRGLFTNPHYLLSVQADAAGGFGVCVLDSLLVRIVVAHFTDDAALTQLRRFLAIYRPQEVLLDRRQVSPEVLRILTQFPTRPLIREIQHTRYDARNLLEGEERRAAFDLPGIVRGALETRLVACAFSVLLNCLKLHFLIARVLLSVRYYIYDAQTHAQTSAALPGPRHQLSEYLLIDAGSLEQLHVLNDEDQPLRPSE